jgi:hypothetical protein
LISSALTQKQKVEGILMDEPDLPPELEFRQAESELERTWVRIFEQNANPSYRTIVLIPGCRLQFRGTI